MCSSKKEANGTFGYTSNQKESRSEVSCVIFSRGQLTWELISQEGFIDHTELEAIFLRGVVLPGQDNSGIFYVPVRAGSTALKASWNGDLGCLRVLCVCDPHSFLNMVKERPKRSKTHSCADGCKGRWMSLSLIWQWFGRWNGYSTEEGIKGMLGLVWSISKCWTAMNTLLSTAKHISPLWVVLNPSMCPVTGRTPHNRTSRWSLL